MDFFLIAANRGCSPLVQAFSLRRLGLCEERGLWACGLSGCGTWAYLLRGMSPELAGGFFATGSLGKSLSGVLFVLLLCNKRTSQYQLFGFL